METSLQTSLITALIAATALIISQWASEYFKRRNEITKEKIQVVSEILSAMKQHIQILRFNAQDHLTHDYNYWHKVFNKNEKPVDYSSVYRSVDPHDFIASISNFSKLIAIYQSLFGYNDELQKLHDQFSSFTVGKIEIRDCKDLDELSEKNKMEFFQLRKKLANICNLRSFRKDLKYY